MSQDENKLQECVPTNIIDDPKVSEAPQLSSEPVNVVEKVPANVVENELANAVEKNFKPQLSSDKNVAVEVSEDNYDHRQQYTMTSLDQTIIATALPAIALEFKALDQISWVGTAYLLTATAFQPSYGKLSDIFGRKPVFLAAIFLFELGSLLCGLSVNMIMLIISRAIAGVGGGGLIGMVYIIISEIVPIKDRGKYQGMMGGCFGIASVVGPLLGGAFTDKVTWSPTGSFWAKLIRIDWWGAFTLVVATILLLLPLNWAGSKYAWSDPIIIVLLCLGGIGYVIFVLIEAKVAEEPIAPPTTSGLELLPLILSIVIMAITAGQLVSRTVFFSYGAICIFGSILMIVGSGLTITFSEYSSRGQIAGYLLISGLGIGLILQMTVLAGQGIVEHKNLATVTSLLTFFRTMGAVFGVAILGTVFNNVFDSNLPPQLQGSLQGFDPTTTGQASPFIIHDFVIALDAAFKVVIVFSGLTFISSLPLITVKPHRDNIQDENMLTLA
ncbi:7399_t:CDS:10 [Gigaspora margarita]|uniref:MFS-type drug efflux transporter P55 n=1 Tax=Gigaspora margarita TaxID=4874 RepID=A0ABN7VZG0_GIGMA|nr:7399_t:CDS:10 [Gigaspora margarita]